MKRIVLWCLSTITAVVLLFGYHTSTSSTLATSNPPAVVGSAAPGAAKSHAGTGASSGSGSTSGSRSGSGSGSGSAKTSVTGSVASTQWGPVQVQLTLAGGSIIRVDVLQYPNGNSTDSQINGYALPILVQETIDQQSGNIDMVSGATITSVGYQQSLQSALDQVKA